LSEFIPKFRPSTPQKLAKQGWVDSEEPQVILFQGMRGSGKGVAVDYIAEKLYQQGINIWHIWGARSFENIYWAINKNCLKHYSKIKIIADAFFDETHCGGIGSRCISKGMNRADYDKYLEIMIQQKIIERVDDKRIKLTKIGFELHNRKLLHCNCTRAFPILWIVPDYIEIDQESLDRFNGFYWSGLEEYKNYFLEITTKEKELLSENKLKKPKEFCSKPLIIVRQITPPTNSSRKEKFQEQFTKIILEARKEHRIVVMNPAIFEFAQDKFDTLAEIIRMIPYLMNKSGHFKPLTEGIVGKPRKYWNKWQKSWHKVAIVINELRSVAPSSRLSGERESSKSKKAVFDFIPEARHMKTWFLGDYQNPEDLYAGVRYQANIVVIKRASRNILGNDWAWLFDKIKNDRIGFLRKYCHADIERPEDVYKYEKHPKVREFLNDRRPRTDELPDNKGYVTFPNGEIKLQRFEMPTFHHKTSLEDFQLDTGITWKVNYTKKPKTQDTSEAKLQKSQREKIQKKIDYMVTVEKKSFKEVKDELVILEESGEIQNFGFADKDPKYFNNMYLKWKKKQEENM